MATFKINELQDVHHYVITEEPLWLDSSGEKVVAEGDPKAARLLASKGKRLSRSDALRYGLVKPKKGEKGGDE